MQTKYSRNAYRSQDVKKNKYDIERMMKENVFSWITSRRMYHKIIHTDMENKNILKTTITGSGKGKRYEILEKNIIKFHTVYGPGINLLKNK